MYDSDRNQAWGEEGDTITWRVTVDDGTAIQFNFDVFEVPRVSWYSSRTGDDRSQCSSKIQVFDGYDAESGVEAWSGCGFRSDIGRQFTRSNVMFVKLVLRNTAVRFYVILFYAR